MAVKSAPGRKSTTAPSTRAKSTPSSTRIKRPAISDTPIRHISPEEAVAHIQALLDAKQDRSRQEPTWPGAGSVPSANADASNLPDASTGAGGSVQTNPPRDDLGKRGG